MSGIKVLLVAGPLDPTISYEFYNFQLPLERLVDKVVAFDFAAELHSRGLAAMNQELLATIKREHPDVAIFVPHTDQFIPEVIDEINQYTVTIGYLFDDMWRIEYSRFWARHFTYITTSDVNGVKKFQDTGFRNVIYSPFACNHLFYRKKELPKLYDVTFVGQYHPYREWYITYLKRAGIEVHVWGRGWPSEVLPLHEMVDVFNQSRINLNLSNSISWDARYLVTPLRPLKSSLRVWGGIIRAVSQSDMKIVEQIKGRHFEINACGGFQLSYYVEGLERCYQIGSEIALYADPKDLVQKVRYYLRHDDERQSVAQNGYERTLKDHTMDQRLREILDHVGLAVKV
jgi:spore maturation protein CgeB